MKTVKHTGPLTRQLRLAPGEHDVGLVPERLRPDAIATSVCGFCSTGCSLDVHLREGRAVNLTPTPGHPVNDGAACPKGWAALAPLGAADRATRPLARNARGRLVPVDWDEALRRFVDGMRLVANRHGPDATAFLSTGQIVTEEMALLGALAKHAMGIVHGDGNTRQCMATAATAYKESFGFDAPPFSYQDLEESDVIVLWGSNLAIAHPILWRRVLRNPRSPTVIAIDPRATETTQAASWHVPLRPKSDLSLAYGVARILIERGWIDRAFVDAHTEGFAELAAHVEAFTLERVARDTGLEAAAVVRLAETIHRGERVSQWWTMGINQSHQGVRTAQAIIALALLTGHIGKPGTGANSITGQCNAMGSRLFSNTTCLFGGRDFTDAGHRAEVARILAIDEACIPRRPSWAYDRILEGARTGVVRALWVIGTNPAHSWLNRGGLDDALGRLDFLVVQDMYASTETARRADLVLPAAGWGEKEGTFINSERRIQRIQHISRPPGEALADFSIFRLIAERWSPRSRAMFAAWDRPERVFAILRRLSAGTPCDFSAVDGYATLTAEGGVQWGGARLFTDGRFFTPSGRARLRVADPAPLPEPPSRRYPFLLLTGRGGAAQWHTETRTAKSPVLRALAPGGAWIEINPDDGAPLGLKHGEPVMVASRRGTVIARALFTHRVQRGEVFMTMHDPATNQLTVEAFDPCSRQPAYKASAVSLARPEPWELELKEPRAPRR